MKTFLKHCIFAAFLFSFSISAQSIPGWVKNSQTVQKTNKNIKNPNALKTVIINNASTSSNSRAPQGSQRYIRTCYIVTVDEMMKANIPSGAKFTKIGFNYSANQNIATTGKLKIYLQNTTDLAWSKNLTWSNGSTGTIDNMTLVQDGDVTIPNSVGTWDISLSKGDAFTYTGGALYIAFEYQNPAGNLSTNNTALCLSSYVGGTNGLRNSYSTTTLPATLDNSSSFRPETRICYNNGKNNDAAVDLVYSYGKVPANLRMPIKISALLSNMGSNQLSNLNVNLDVSGANSFKNSKVVSSLPIDGANTIVTFDSFVPATKGVNNITVNLDTDNNIDNNSLSSKMIITDSTLAYCDESEPVMGCGFSSGSGLILAKYYINNLTSITSVSFNLYDFSSNINKYVYGVVLDSTGRILDSSPYHYILSSELGKSITLNLSKNIRVNNQNIYIGVAIPSSGYYPVSFQAENPVRKNTYFTSGISGSAITEFTTFGRPMIELNTPGVIVQPPVITSVKQTTGDSFYIQWDSVAGATNYILDIGKDISFTNYLEGYKDKNVGKLTSLTVSGINSNTNYYIRIRAQEGNNISAYSLIWNFATINDTIYMPRSLVVGNNFKKCIPLSWIIPIVELKTNKSLSRSSQTANAAVNDFFTSQKYSPNSLSYYKIYRGNQAEQLHLIDSTKEVDYIDTNVVPNNTYYYAVSYVSGEFESQKTKIGSAMCDTSGYKLSIPFGKITPNIDGNITNGEWGDAVFINIKNKLASHGNDAIGFVPKSNVSCYLKKIDNFLYIAINDYNDNDQNLFDQLGIYFDNNNNKRFDAGEGNFWIIDSLVQSPSNQYREIIGSYPPSDTSFALVRYNTEGVTSATSFANKSNHRAWEVKIDLTNSKMKLTDESIFGLYLFALDQYTTNYSFNYNGWYPTGNIWRGPQTYAEVNFTKNTISPVAYEATGISSQSFTANWAPVNGAQKYCVELSKDSQFTSNVLEYDNLDAGNRTSLTITNLEKNRNYYYRVRSGDSLSFGPASNIITVELPIDSTFAPHHLIAGNGFKNLIPLTWWAPSNNRTAQANKQKGAAVKNLLQPQITKPSKPENNFYYKIYRNNKTEPFKLIGTSTREDYVDTTVFPGIVYNYKVTYVSGNVESIMSSQASACCDSTDFYVNVPEGNIIPIIDGNSKLSEWGDAALVNIENNLGWLGNDTVFSHPYSNVNCYMKKVGNFLYISVIDGNDYIRDYNDRLNIYFDNNCNNIFDQGDGHLIIEDKLGASPTNSFQELVGAYPNVSYQPLEIAQGITSAHGETAYLMTWELKIDLTNSKIRPLDSKTFRFNISVTDNYHETLNGWGPVGSINDAPITFSNVRIIEKPIIPVAYPATHITSGSFVANWSHIEGLNNYYLELSRDSLFASSTLYYWEERIDAKNYTFKLIDYLKKKSDYYYRVRVGNKFSAGPVSNTIHVKTLANDSTLAIRELTAAGGLKSCIPLSWENPEYYKGEKKANKLFNDLSGIIGNRDSKVSSPNYINYYKIYRKKENDNYKLIDSLTTRAYIDSSVVAGINYSYRVSFIMNGIESIPSNEVTAACSDKDIQLSIPVSTITPILDGNINEQEWTDAQIVNIKNNVGYGKIVPAKDVLFYIKTVGDSLFYAIRDYNDVEKDADDGCILFFDKNCNNLYDSGDGAYFSIDSLRKSPVNFYERFVNSGFWYLEADSLVSSPKGFSSTTSLTKGYREWEIKIDMKNSQLIPDDKNIFGLLIASLDQENGAIDGIWPNTNLIIPSLFAKASLEKNTRAYALTGSVNYANASNSAIANTKIFLTQNGRIIDSSATGAAGNYAFNTVTGGTYNISVKNSSDWKGVNSTDALLVRKYTLGLLSFDSLQIKAADVNASGNINNTDALLIGQRWSGSVNSFESGDWIFENPTITINGNNTICNIKGLCAGDVNRSYLPYLAKEKQCVTLNKSKTNKSIFKDGNIEFPITVNNTLKIGAISLLADFSLSDADLIGIKSKADGFTYSISSGKILIAWNSLTPLELNAGETLFTLLINPKDKNGKTINLKMDIENESEIADENGNVIENVSLSVPELVFQGITEFKLEQNYPNPFNPSTTIRYAIPVESEVKLTICNPLGQTIRTLVNEIKTVGCYEVKFDAGDLPSGIYFYFITAKSTDGTKNYKKVNKLILLK